MSEYRIYHNPKCSKSRQTLELLKEHGIEPQIIEYLKEPLTEAQVTELINILDAEPTALVRTKEDLFKENKPSIESPQDIAKAIAKYPKLMERPVVVRGKKAVLGRPPENIKKLM